jgi:hypothetical protein
VARREFGTPTAPFAILAFPHEPGAKIMSDNPYASAIHLLERSAEMIDQQKEPGLWTLNKGLLHLAKAIQQDMAEFRRTLGEINSDVKSIR